MTVKNLQHCIAVLTAYVVIVLHKCKHTYLQCRTRYHTILKRKLALRLKVAVGIYKLVNGTLSRLVMLGSLVCPELVGSTETLLDKCKLKYALCHIYHTCIYSVAIDVSSVLALVGVYKPVGKLRGMTQVGKVAVCLILVYKHTYRSRRVLYTALMKLWLNRHRVVQKCIEIVEAFAQLCIELRLLEVFGCNKRRVESVPTLYMGCCLLMILKGSLSCSFHSPLPRLGSDKHTGQCASLDSCLYIILSRLRQYASVDIASATCTLR